VRVVAYSICRRCASVYPERRRCPACDGDAAAALAIANASAHAIEQAPAAPGLRRRRAIPAIVLFALVLALGATVAAIAAPGRGGDGASAPGGSAQVGQ